MALKKYVALTVRERYVLMGSRARTTLIIDDQLVERAREITGIQEKAALVRAGLEVLVSREAGKGLAALGGTQPKLAATRRRRVN
jgi:Arc/MetJ family transcription regulator